MKRWKSREGVETGINVRILGEGNKGGLDDPTLLFSDASCQSFGFCRIVQKKTKSSCPVTLKEKGENPSSGFLEEERNLVRFPSEGPEGKEVFLQSCQVHLSSSTKERKRRE